MMSYKAQVLLINIFARLLGGLALIAGSVFLVSAFAVEAERWTYVAVGLLQISIGLAVFAAKPVTVETIAGIRRRMGHPDQ